MEELAGGPLPDETTKIMKSNQTSPYSVLRNSMGSELTECIT